MGQMINYVRGSFYATHVDTKEYISAAWVRSLLCDLRYMRSCNGDVKLKQVKVMVWSCGWFVSLSCVITSDGGVVSIKSTEWNPVHEKNCRFTCVPRSA